MIEPERLPYIETLIDNYMAIYRAQYPNKTIPKQHLLEQHCIPYIKKYKIGLGLMGEQGTEASHQTISQIEHSRAFAIKDKMKKAEFIMTTHILQILTKLQPEDQD